MFSSFLQSWKTGWYTIKKKKLQRASNHHACMCLPLCLLTASPKFGVTLTQFVTCFADYAEFILLVSLYLIFFFLVLLHMVVQILKKNSSEALHFFSSFFNKLFKLGYFYQAQSTKVTIFCKQTAFTFKV